MYKLKIKPNNTIHTQWGNAKLDDNRYYRITSRKEGNHYQYFHRLLFEKYYGEIPKDYQIHHKDKNRDNNCICNLSLLKKEEHLKLHKKGNKHQMSSCFIKINVPNANKVSYSDMNILMQMGIGKLFQELILLN